MALFIPGTRKGNLGNLQIPSARFDHKKMFVGEQLRVNMRRAELTAKMPTRPVSTHITGNVPPFQMSNCDASTFLHSLKNRTRPIRSLVFPTKHVTSFRTLGLYSYIMCNSNPNSVGEVSLKQTVMLNQHQSTLHTSEKMG